MGSWCLWDSLQEAYLESTFISEASWITIQSQMTNSGADIDVIKGMGMIWCGEIGARLIYKKLEDRPWPLQLVPHLRLVIDIIHPWINRGGRAISWSGGVAIKCLKKRDPRPSKNMASNRDMCKVVLMAIAIAIINRSNGEDRIAYEYEDTAPEPPVEYVDSPPAHSSHHQPAPLYPG